MGFCNRALHLEAFNCLELIIGNLIPLNARLDGVL